MIIVKPKTSNRKIQNNRKPINSNLLRFLVGIYLLVGILTLGFPAEAVDSTAAAMAHKLGGGSLGYMKVGSSEVANISWQPDFKFGVIGLGLDVNIPLTGTKPSGYENVVLRYVEYDDGKRGARYGVIENLTWGHGMLVSRYSTRVAGPLLLNNSQLGFKGYIDMEKYVVRVLYTKTGVHGLRVEERVHPLLTLGQTYVADSDGVTPVGTTTNQKETGVGVDATVPLPFNLAGFAEYAMLQNRGSGSSVGLGWAADVLIASASLKGQYRIIDSRFVPGYFNAEYESNPINLTSAEATGNSKNGYIVEFAAQALGLAKLTAIYENYNESAAAVTGALFAKLPQDVEVTGYYQQPKFVDFSSLTLEQGAVMGGTMAYPLNPYMKAVIHYKKVYNPTTAQVEESQYYEVKFSL